MRGRPDPDLSLVRPASSPTRTPRGGDLLGDALHDGAESLVAELADADFAADWQVTVGTLAERVDHPALASAYRGGAMHRLTFDERLLGAEAGAALRGRMGMSVRRSDAFVALFDAQSLYTEVVGGAYPAPDCDSRA